MPTSFPLSIAEFILALPVSDAPFMLGEAVEVSRTRGGQQLTASVGVRLWQGSITLGRATRAEMQKIEALLDILRQPGATFLATDLRRPAPITDPTGQAAGSATPSIRALDTQDARLVALKGLPAAYRLSRSDYLGFSYGSSPTRRALHRVVDATVDADGTGDTALFEVVPRLRPGAAVDAAVSLVRPACTAVIVADSFDPGNSRQTISEGATLRWEQSLT